MPSMTRRPRLTDGQKAAVVHAAIELRKEAGKMPLHHLYNKANELALDKEHQRVAGGPSEVPDWFVPIVAPIRVKPAAVAPAPALIVPPADAIGDAFQALFIKAMATPEGQAAIQAAVRPLLGQALITLGEAVLKGEQ